jgi:exonuclease III
MFTMLGAFWNIRGLNKSGRLKCVSDFICSNKLDFVALQDTKKENFSVKFIEATSRNFNWYCMLAKGTAGGVLIGLNQVNFDTIAWQYFKCCAVVIIRNQCDNSVWRLIIVYGFPYEDTKLKFINELHEVMGAWSGPTLIGGDFNQVRSQKEKNNGVIIFSHVEQFNNWINTWGLLEIKDPNRIFSWSNNQRPPIMAKLDRILCSVDWDSKYPLAQVKFLPKGVSDHNPMGIDFGNRGQKKDHLIRFEKWWLEVKDFEALVRKTCDVYTPCTDPVDI